MNDINRQLSYKAWLDELSTTPSEAFFPTFRQFFDLLINENTPKIEILINSIGKETIQLTKSANIAIKELEKLFILVENSLKGINGADLTQLEHYEQVKNGKTKIIGEDLPDTLYHSIRLTIEKHKNNGLLNNFGDALLSVHENFWYLDYAKTTEVYPSYKQYKNAKDLFEKQRKEQPWGAYVYLKWATTFFKDVSLEQTSSFVSTDIINNLRRLILYLLTPTSSGSNKREIVYEITYSPWREVLLNKDIKLSKPDFDSENDIVFNYLYKNPNKKIYRDGIEKEEGREISKSLHKIVENLGFKGDLKKVFFQVSKNAICFNNPITKEDLEALGISKIKLP